MYTVCQYARLRANSERFNNRKIVSEYDQEIPQSQTADKPIIGSESGKLQWMNLKFKNSI